MKITSRDCELSSALVQKVRLFTQRQIADHWWDGDMANTRRRLTILRQAGLVQRMAVPARTLPPIEAPVLIWQPGQPIPAFGQIGHTLRERWRAPRRPFGDRVRGHRESSPALRR